MPLSQRRQEARLVLFYKIINGLAQVPFVGVLVEAYKGTRRNHNMKFRQIGHTTGGSLPTTKLDTVYRRHRVRFRSDHNTHQHTHCQQNFHKHHTDGRQAEHTKGQDAQQRQALARRNSMQNHSKK